MILLYKAREEVKNILQEMNLNYRIIDDSMLHETLGYLFRLDGFHQSETIKTYTFPFDIMIIHDVQDEVIQKMTQRLRDANLNIERKAMLTKHNQHWSMGELLKEIDAEHAFFQFYDKIMVLLKESENLHPEDYDPLLWKAYEQAFIEAYQILQTKPEHIEILENAYNNLNNAKQAL